MAPCVWNASIAYSEQVGVKRQPLPEPKRKICAGEIVSWYTRMASVRTGMTNDEALMTKE